MHRALSPVPSRRIARAAEPARYDPNDERAPHGPIADLNVGRPSRVVVRMVEPRSSSQPAAVRGRPPPPPYGAPAEERPVGPRPAPPEMRQAGRNTPGAPLWFPRPHVENAAAKPSRADQPAAPQVRRDPRRDAPMLTPPLPPYLPADSEASALPQRHIAVFVDGFTFATRSGHDPAALDRAVEQVRAHLAFRHGCSPDDVSTPKEALNFFYPDHHEYRDKVNPDVELFLRTDTYINSLRRKGWTVHQTDLKQVRGALVASREDIAMAMEVAKACAPNYLRVHGTARPNVTDVVLITADQDHIETVERLARHVTALLWLAIPFAQRDSARKLLRWGEDTGRLIELPLATSPAPAAAVAAPPTVPVPAGAAPPMPRRCEQPRTCAQFDCTGSHDAARPTRCPDVHTCADAQCWFLHPVIAAVGHEPMRSNRLLPTDGKRRAVAGVPVALCDHHHADRAACRYGPACHFLHVVGGTAGGESAAPAVDQASRVRGVGRTPAAADVAPLAGLLAMGFPHERARAAVAVCGGDVRLAADFLCELNGAPATRESRTAYERRAPARRHQ